MDQFDYSAYADYTQHTEMYSEQINENNTNVEEAQLPDTIPAPEPVIQADPDEDSDIIMMPNLEQHNVKPETETAPEPMPEPEIDEQQEPVPEPQQTEATEPTGLDTISLSPKTKSKSKSKKSRKKRKYEEMETEQRQESVGDVIEDTPLSPKRLKLDPSQSTLARLSQVQLFSDIIFNVRGVTFHGIKSIFAIKSIKLQQLMYPADNTMVNTLEINDISAIAFRFIKDFVYDMSPSLDVDNVIDVLQASQLYEMPAITEQCTTFLAGIDSVDNFLKVLQPFGVTDNTEIFDNILNGENTIKLLQEHGEEIINSEIFGALSFNVARRILQSDNLGIKEEDIFNKALTWNGEDIKGIIRFTRMDLQFLYDTVKPSGILSANDLVQIYEYKLGFIQELNGFNCNERFEVATKPKRGGRGKTTKAATKKKSEPSTPKKSASKKKSTSTKKKKGSTKKKTASKKKAATKRKSTRKK